MVEQIFSAEIEKQKAEQKHTASWFATVTWIISGIYLFASTPGAHFFSIQALIFFPVGMFAAAIVLGIAMYASQRSISWVFAKVIGIPSPTVASLIGLVGIGLMIGQIVIVYLVARQVFHAMI